MSKQKISRTKVRFSIKLKPITIISIFLCSFILYAQEPLKTEDKAKKSYFIEEGNKGASIYQHLSWEAIDNILGFEFVLEKQDNSGNWIQIDKKNLKKNSINVSLQPGKYRYKVAIINLLNQLDSASEYRNFDVRIAYQPEVLSLSVNTIYFDETDSDSLIVLGNNLFAETIFTLNKDTENPIPCTVIEADKDGKKIKLKLDFSKFSPGIYTFTATDPSGLHDSSKNIAFAFQKPLDIFLSLGYTFSAFMQNKILYRYFKSNIYPAGGSLRFSIIPIKKLYGRIGFNLSASGLFLKSSKDEIYTLKSGFIIPQFNLVYMFPIIKRRLNFDLHLGGGAAFLIQAKFTYPESDIQSPVYWFWCPSVNGGTAVQVYLYKKLYFEINLDHIILFRKDFPKYVIQPSLSLGWEF
ncbi:hypothetical protein [Treponema putidum]|uniref:Uncharacterized protein n=1 Tax=Treponema putidum TaxID=221027 RepID=A0AAE9MSH7_9SPIR|nr:hypothetical protein [Treponema putidum]UTY30398.1 hypothetical protein E4N75_01690 [Treponema putidum]UTY32870.1 hypothetical protein E4N74_01740 [Treponema putidum]